MEKHLTSLIPLHRMWYQSWQISHLMYLVLPSILLKTQYVTFAGTTHSSLPYFFVFLELRVSYRRKFIFFKRLVKLHRKEVQAEWAKKLSIIMMIFVNKIFIYLISTLTAFMVEFCWRFHTHLLKSC